VSATDDENDGQATERVVIRDRRKIDGKGDQKDSAAKAKGKAAVGGAHRAADPEETPVVEAEPAEEAKPDALGAELEGLRNDLDERTHDLQRVTAEYANYRKRVDRDRGAAAEQTTARCSPRCCRCSTTSTGPGSTVTWSGRSRRWRSR